MAKYSYEFKKKVVDAYNNGEGSYRYLAKKFKMPNKAPIQRWVNNYNAFGDAGLRHSPQKEIYSFQKKLSVVELYLSSEVSYQELALQEGITNSNMIANWVQRFRAGGLDALRPRKKGRKKTMGSYEEKPSAPSVETSVDANAEHIKELEDELLKLRIENAFLKELRRLRLEEEAKMRERRESLTASEDSSD